MFSKSIEKKLQHNSAELAKLKQEHTIMLEQRNFVSEGNEDLRLRSIVSETPLAGSEYNESNKVMNTYEKNLKDIVDKIAKLEKKQDDLLDQMSDR